MCNDAKGITTKNAQKYATIFVDNKLTTIERIASDIKRDANILSTVIKVDDYDAKALVESLVQLNLLSLESAAVKKYTVSVNSVKVSE